MPDEGARPPRRSDTWLGAPALSNIVALVMMLGALYIFFSRLEVEIGAVDTKVEAHSDRLKTLESKVDKQTSDLGDLKAGIAEVKGRIEDGGKHPP